MKPTLLEAAARGAHEALRAFALAHGERHTPHWEQLPESERAVALAAVRRVGEGCTAREIHEAWVSDMLRAGWHEGPRDMMEKTHPALVSWEALAPVERARAILANNVMHSMLSAFPLKSRLG